jgi:predicted transcriptional regulator
MFRKLTNEFKKVTIATRKKRGDQTEVADQLTYSPSHVSNVLAGRRNNTAITNTMYRKVFRRESQLA